MDSPDLPQANRNTCTCYYPNHDNDNDSDYTNNSARIRDFHNSHNVTDRLHDSDNDWDCTNNSVRTRDSHSIYTSTYTTPLMVKRFSKPQNRHIRARHCARTVYDDAPATTSCRRLIDPLANSEFFLRDTCTGGRSDMHRHPSSKNRVKIFKVWSRGNWVHLPSPY